MYHNEVVAYARFYSIGLGTTAIVCWSYKVLNKKLLCKIFRSEVQEHLLNVAYTRTIRMLLWVLLMLYRTSYTGI